jgi:hypothetical protein
VFPSYDIWLEPAATGYIFVLYCSINNWIRHTFHNLETFSLIYIYLRLSPLLSNFNGLNLLTVSAFPNCHVQPLTQCSACGRQSVFGRSRSWRMLECCLSQYCDFIQQGIPPAMLVWRITCVEIYWGRMNSVRC